ncbi:hypothetical protein AKJ16_DCAP05575 [Drosera capensis]
MAGSFRFIILPLVVDLVEVKFGKTISPQTRERRKGKEKTTDTSRRGEKRSANMEPLDSCP